MSIVGAGSCNKERPPSLSVSVAVTHDITCTGLILHLSFFKMTLDLYVYVALSDGGLFSLQFLDGTFSGVSLHCAVNSFCRDSLGRGRDPLYYPSIHEK